jgi:putative Holliday junction resolvase
MIMRILGIDFGERRVGVALSDPTGTLASPLPTLKRRAGKRPPLAAIEALIEEHGVVALVLGLPLTPRGEDSDWTREVREVGGALARRTGLPVHLVDERFTSVQAERAVRGVGLPKGKREEKERIDAAAAVLILQGWLNRRKEREGRESSDPGGAEPGSGSLGEGETGAGRSRDA